MVRGSEIRIFPGFYSFELSERPLWWRDQLSLEGWGPVIGVHEVEGSARGAIVVTETGLAVYREPEDARWLPYESISAIRQLSKEPIAKELVLRTTSGEDVAFPFPDGSAFAFVQFIAYVTLQLALMEKAP